MRTTALFLILAGALAPARRSAASEVELPRQVPAAKLTQQVGLTEIAIEYDCPAVKGRTIWGGVVPFDRPWTIGANLGTKIKFSRDVRIGDQAVPAGSYWLLAVPGKSKWTLMLNKSPDTTAPARVYKPELDVVRVKVSPKPAARHESLTFTFSDITDDQASLDLEWEALRVSLPIQLNTTQQVLASINGLDGTWRAFANAARYMLETKKDYDAGLKYIDQALALKDDWYSMWIKGALLAAKGDYGSAREWGERARRLSERVGNGAALAPDLNNAIAEWTRKSAGRLDNEAHVQNEAHPSKEAHVSEEGHASKEAHASKETQASKEAPAKKVGNDSNLSNVASGQDGLSTAAPTFSPESAKETSRAPLGDPPPVHRARLRHR